MLGFCVESFRKHRAVLSSECQLASRMRGGTPPDYHVFGIRHHVERVGAFASGLARPCSPL